MLRRLLIVALPALVCANAHAEQPGADVATFKAYVQALRPDAEARGIARATFDLAFAGLTSDERVAATTRRQPEYNSAVPPRSHPAHPPLH